MLLQINIPVDAGNLSIAARSLKESAGNRPGITAIVQSLGDF